MVLLNKSNVRIEWASLWNVPDEKKTEVLGRYFRMRKAVLTKTQGAESVHSVGRNLLSDAEKLIDVVFSGATHKGAETRIRSAIEDHMDEITTLAQDLGVDTETITRFIAVGLGPFDAGEDNIDIVLQAHDPDSPPPTGVGTLVSTIIQFIPGGIPPEKQMEEERLARLGMPSALATFCAAISEHQNRTVLAEVFNDEEQETGLFQLTTPYYMITFRYDEDDPPQDAQAYLEQLASLRA